MNDPRKEWDEMEQNIRLDVNHMMADMLGSEYGVTSAQLDSVMHRTSSNASKDFLFIKNSLPFFQQVRTSRVFPVIIPQENAYCKAIRGFSCEFIVNVSRAGPLPFSGGRRSADRRA